MAYLESEQVTTAIMRLSLHIQQVLVSNPAPALKPAILKFLMVCSVKAVMSLKLAPTASFPQVPSHDTPPAL